MKRLCIVILLLFVAASSCKKNFLEVIDKSVLLKQGYVIDLETNSHYLNGLYSDLAGYLAAGYYLAFQETMADNIKPVSSSFLPTAYNWRFSDMGQSGNGDPLDIWRRYYAIIRGCSFVIEKANQFKSEDEAFADQLKGQAMAIRAWMHFNLVNTFAQSYNFSPGASHLGIPYIKTSDTEIPVSRQPVAEVYSEMVNDLNAALQFLPKGNINKQKMKYYAAKALLVRVYLFKEDFNSTKNTAAEILSEVPIMTTDYPEKLYTLDEAEALFLMPPGSSPAENYNAVFIGFRARAAAPACVATQDVATILQENLDDKRSNWVTKSGTRWLITKFPTSVTGNFPLGADGDYYQTLLRSTEVCLNAAEACARSNDLGNARNYIDQIRLRANPNLTNLDANISGPALLDSIYKERRKEMCFDGYRMWDLQRWKKGVERLDSNNPDAKNLSYPNNKAIAALPRQDVQISGLQQNPGY